MLDVGRKILWKLINSHGSHETHGFISIRVIREIRVQNKTRMKTILMAGGRGTRIAELFPDIPKPLIPVGGMPILEREIRSLCAQGFKDII